MKKILNYVLFLPLVGIFFILASYSKVNAGANYYYFSMGNFTSSSPAMNFNYGGNSEPSVLYVGNTYTLSETFTINHLYTTDLYNGHDILGLQANKILESGGTNLQSGNDGITIGALNTNRQNGNDNQEAVASDGTTVIGSNKYFNQYLCGNSEVHVTPYNSSQIGKTYTVTCQFTPRSTGYFQVDAVDYAFQQYNQNNQGLTCAKGYCGAQYAVFLRVVNQTPNLTASNNSTIKLIVVVYISN